MTGFGGGCLERKPKPGRAAKGHSGTSGGGRCLGPLSHRLQFRRRALGCWEVRPWWEEGPGPGLHSAAALTPEGASGDRDGVGGSPVPRMRHFGTGAAGWTWGGHLARQCVCVVGLIRGRRRLVDEGCEGVGGKLRADWAGKRLCRLCAGDCRGECYQWSRAVLHWAWQACLSTAADSGCNTSPLLPGTYCPICAS